MKLYDLDVAPYIGITDFMTREQTLEMLDFYQKLTNGKIPHKLMIGVMMSYKTLHKQETKWTNAFPRSADVMTIFADHPLAFNTLHYADYTNTDVFNSLAQAIFYGGVLIDALQLDMVWPEPSDVFNAVHASRKSIAVILQVGKNALAEAKDSPEEVIERLKDYLDVIDGVLLDKSMGKGKTMDTNVLLPFVEAIYEKLPQLRVAVAGGLGPFTMPVAEPIISRYNNVSIDAQGRLRPSGNALDPIDWDLARKYLNEAVKLYMKYHQIS